MPAGHTSPDTFIFLSLRVPSQRVYLHRRDMTERERERDIKTKHAEKRAILLAVIPHPVDDTDDTDAS